VSVVVLAATILGRPLLAGRRWAWLALPIGALAVAALARVDAIALILFLPPVLLNAYLAWLFGHTLAPGSSPFLERLVRLLQPPGVPFEPGVIDYTRKLTRLWTGLFLSFGAINLVLAALARPGGLLETAGIEAPVSVPIDVWSLFANVFNYLIVAALFLLEFAYRRRRFPGRPYRNLPDFLHRSIAVVPALVATISKPRTTLTEGPATVFEQEFTIPVDHPAFAGHFPGRAVLPAVVLLDLVAESARTVFGRTLNIEGLPRAKFTSPLAPGDRCRFRLTLRENDLEFIVSRGRERVAQGLLRLRAAGPFDDR
jgi:uncharacterized membrane protein/3-hydroxymyristoyl/3-hydroxydecanoyl-(acyl carrier protein) dehydratase